MSKSILNSHWSNSVQKTAQKNSNYSTNETMLKIGHLSKAIACAWAIAHAKAKAFARWPIFSIVSFLEYLVFFRAVFFTELLQSEYRIDFDIL